MRRSDQLLAEEIDAGTPVDRLETRVQGRPHTQNLARWRCLVEAGDVEGIRAVLLSPAADAIQMREVSPMGGIITEAERRAALHSIRRS
ncbi:hypothetical protein ACT4S5_13020 [Kocuria oceani]|uniref:hypothetical protein n=1 Tax=Kocuria oceani TaxID=988827 RepID=UPI0040373FB5